MRVSVLGSGSWGTTVASIAARRNECVVWSRRNQTVDEINLHHTNERYLAGFALNPELTASGDLAKVCSQAEVLVVGVPAQVVRQVLTQAKEFIPPGVPVVSLAKGLEQGTQLRMTEVIAEVLPDNPASVLTGPNLAKEIMAGHAAASVIGCVDMNVAERLQEVFRAPLFRVYRNHDVIGCELGGALKNVIALATGIAQGLSVGDNTRSLVITRGLAELTRLGVSLGGESATFAGLAGMGDLMATCISPQSRNRYVGEQLGLGRDLDDIIEEMSNVAEGVKTAPVVAQLADERGVRMPVCCAIAQVVSGEIPARQAYSGLLSTPGGHETDPAGPA